MPDTDTTARAVFADMNAMADRYPGQHIVILGAVMAWVETQALDADEDTFATAYAIATRIQERAMPMEAMN